MNILFLTQIIPYPLDAGPKIKTWHVLKHLAGQGHHIFLASFVRPDEIKAVERVRQICDAVHTVPIRRSRVNDVFYWLCSNATGRPFLIERDDIVAMRTLVNQLLSTKQINCIHADQLTMTQFALPSNASPSRHNALAADPKEQSADGHRPFCIFDAHNAVWTIFERLRQTSPWFTKPILAAEARRIKRYEGMVTHSFDHILTVTESDRQSLIQAYQYYLGGSNEGVNVKVTDSGLPMTVIPIAIDTEQLQPVKRRSGSLNILTLGTLQYPPNADGIRWFIHEVYPLVREQVPRASLTIVGKNPPQDFVQLAANSQDAITVTGYVPDLKPYLEQANQVVVPVRVGSGMRVRILEAFAQAMPVVTTTIGLEGIEASPDEDVLVADTPADFAARVVNVLTDETLQNRLSMNGRRLVEKCYDWRAVLQKLDSIYEDIHIDN